MKIRRYWRARFPWNSQRSNMDQKTNKSSDKLGEKKKNFPQIALQNYLRLKDYPQFFRLTQAVLTTLTKMIRPQERADFVHDLVDQEMNELFKDPSVNLLTACKKGCAACCHTQVSVTSDEAEVLAGKIIDGHPINWANLHIQQNAGTDFDQFMQISYQQRKCVFLNEQDMCSIYDDRPSVCRTNAVVGTSEQCQSDDGQMRSQNILNTHKADMVLMGAFMHSQENGVMANMIWNVITEKFGTNSLTINSENSEKKSKSIFKQSTVR